jgi:hypothetical protein
MRPRAGTKAHPRSSRTLGTSLGRRHRLGKACYKATLRRLALRDDNYIESLLAKDPAGAAEAGIDSRAHALVRVGAWIAIDAAPPTYMSAAACAAAFDSHSEFRSEPTT